MTERCSNCGAEVYAGQQFCRRCGAPVAREDAPTQMFPQGTQPNAPTAGTNVLGRDAGTNPVGPPTAYQPPLQSFQQTSPLTPHSSLAMQQAPRKGGRGRWLVALLVVFVLCVGAVGGAGYMLWRARRSQMIVKKFPVGEHPPIPVPPNLPEKINEQVREALGESGVPLPLDESGATVSGDKTVLNETYELDGDATVSFRGVSGDVSVTGWDEDHAEVKVTKSGGSADARRGVPVLMSKSDEGLSFITAAAPGGPVRVSYEVKLPRNLHQIEISAEKGDVKIKEFNGSVALNLTEGDISVSTSGAARVKLVNGKASITYNGHHEEPQEFTVVNGDVEVSFGGEPEANVKAESTTGDVKVDDTFGVKAEKRAAGHKLDAQFGGGGAPLTIKVVNGDIKLKK
jgi:hypothetical protein